MVFGNYKFLFICVMCLFVQPWANCHAQSYGLRFFSHEVNQDRRTGLDINPKKNLCLDGSYELLFDISYLPQQKNYYGYVFRLVGATAASVDLICDYSTAEFQHFQLVVDERFTRISFAIPNKKIFNQWNRFAIKFDPKNNLVTVFDGTRHHTDKVKVITGNCVKILFGANNFKEYSVTDVPPMDIKNISLFNNGNLKSRWPLDDDNGAYAHETIQGGKALAANPRWLKKMHQDWSQVTSLSVKGAASISFNQADDIIYITGQDSLFAYNAVSQQVNIVPYTSGQHAVMPGNQSVFIQTGNSKRILNYYMDQQTVTSLNLADYKWNRKFIYPDTASDYWHTNKFYSPADTSLYVLGGYGHFRYKNDIYRYSLNTGKWKQFKAKGDFFTPRYLAALGTVKGGAYVLGGYGSNKGRQALGAKTLFDLMYYDVRKQKFKKIYEITPDKDLALSNSMVIADKKDVYYALSFVRHKYRSSLQLIEGSLKKPEYKFVGNQIPYIFHDIESYADLYYSQRSGKLYAVVMLTKNNVSTVKIYSLLSPPVAASPPAATSAWKDFGKWMMVSFVVMFIAAIVLVVLRSIRLLRYKNDISNPVLTTPLVATVPVKKISAADNVSETLLEANISSSIYLFGDFKIFDKNGQEITKLFTPLIKELFLVIFLYSLRWERAISSEKLRDLLWFDKNEDSARNNRSVSIARLKVLLEQLPYCQIVKESGSWKIAIDSTKVQVDYIDYLNIVRDKRKLNKDKLAELADIIQHGSFLANVEYQWLDAFKSEISNEIIDTYLHFAKSIQIYEDPEFLSRLTSYVSYFDAVNEDALRIKCKSLSFLGKHSLAKQAYENFKKEYLIIYGVEFNEDFQHILS